MAVHLRLLLILSQFTGVYSISKVSKVSVKAGDSVTIPCPYQPSYTNRVKYLCKGHSWNSCSYAVKTNQPDRSGKFSISDDKKGLFTVTIRDLDMRDTDYWCTVEIDHGADHGDYFHLAVRDTPGLSVDRQEIKGYIGDDLTIRCYHGSAGVMQWCRLGSICVTSLWGKIGKKEVNKNSTIPYVSTVTMSNVTRQSSGWYMCVQGDLQMPVHVMVTQRPVTTTSAQLLTPAPGDGTDHSSSVLPMSLTIPLGLLIVVVMVTLFTFFILKKQRRGNSQSSTKATSPRGSDGDVLYSSVVITKPQKDEAKGQVTAQNEDLIYSTLKNSHS